MDLRFVLPEIYGPQDSPTNRYESHEGPLENKRGGGRPVSPRCAARGKEQARGNRFLRLSSVCTKSLHGGMRRESTPLAARLDNDPEWLESLWHRRGTGRMTMSNFHITDERLTIWSPPHLNLPRNSFSRSEERRV